MARKPLRKKAPAARRKRRQDAGSAPARPRGGIARALLWRLTVLGLFALAGYTAYLDFRIRSEFEGKRWSLPAHVFARPLELYPGRALDSRQLERELALLGYQNSVSGQAPGSYSARNGRYRLHTRGFRFTDGDEPSRRFMVEIRDGRVARMVGAELVRLEPARIGGIYPRRNEDRVLVRLDEVPERLVDALMAVEDRAFYRHAGLAPLSILRAMWANLRAGRVVQGGSTLTQQLVKNFFLSNERTLARKASEAIMALLLEWHYDKNDILEAYLNEVYLGQDGRRAIHGLGLASRFYFGRDLQQLELPQIALLVGMIKGPSYYNPRRHPRRARQRRDLVLDLMARQGVITPAQAARARRQPLGVIELSRGSITDYPAFLDLVRRQLRRDYREQDLTSEGLRIFTTLDPWIQDRAEQAVQRQLAALGGERRQLQAALVVSSVEGGEVLALVGGRNPRYAGFNRALDAVRPIGSLVKPAVYLTALTRPRQYNLVTRIEDAPLTLTNPDGSLWQPQNYDHEFLGQIPLHRALAESRNLPTVRLGLDLGVDEVVRTLYRLGVERQVEAWPSLLLGAVSLSPLEVTQVYQTLANGGFHSPLRAIRAVQAADGSTLTRYPLEVRQAVEPGPVFLVDTVLQEVVSSGTARGLRRIVGHELRAAGKTGTTDDLRDSWFAGFTGEHLAVAWIGRDDNGEAGLTGASGALRVWGELMRGLASRPLELVEPPGIEWAWVDEGTGLLSSRGCPGVRRWPFLEGHLPAEGDTCLSGWLRRGLDSLMREHDENREEDDDE